MRASQSKSGEQSCIYMLKYAKDLFRAVLRWECIFLAVTENLQALQKYMH